MHLKEFSTMCSTEITKELQYITNGYRKQIAHQTPDLLSYYEVYVERIYGGKMFRGMLVYLGYILQKSKKSSDLAKIAAAVELIHHSLLIYDDIIDKSEVRRGKTSVYTALGGNHYAISQALGLGGIGINIANKLIAASHFPPKTILQCQSILYETLIHTWMGEMLDVAFGNKQKVATHDSILAIHTLKTAYYSVATPLTIGVILGGGTKNTVKHLLKFGTYLGIVFQIQDDILGIFGDEKTVGKSVTSDIEEGKNTLLIVYAKKHSDDKQKKFLKQYYGAGKISRTVHEEMKDIFIRTGSLAYSKKQITMYMKKAQLVLDTVRGEKEGKDLLYQLISYLENRQY